MTVTDRQGRQIHHVTDSTGTRPGSSAASARVYPEADLQLADVDGDMLTVVDRRAACGRDELFMRTHNVDGGNMAIWLRRSEAQALRDYLDHWLADLDAEDPSVTSWRETCADASADYAPDIAEALDAYAPDIAEALDADSGETLAEWERELLEAHEDGSDCYGQCDTEATAGQDGWAEGQLCTITAEAERAVYGDRHDDYGHPREDFTRTAVMWQGLLLHKLADGASIEPEDIARCMIAVKLARDVHNPKRDNRVDGAGYFLTLDRLETGR